MAKKDDFFGEDAEIVEDNFFGEDAEIVSTEEPTSQLESAARGAAQGLTFDMADELIGAGKAAYDIATGEPKLDDFKNLYSKYRDIEREKFKKAREENPATYMTSDIGVGIIPALFTGGATAAASIGKGAIKEGLKQAAKTGAKYGAATGLGASEADLMKGELGRAAKDVAIGAGTGAAAGIAIPAVGKAIGATGKNIVKGTKELAEKFPTITKPFQFAAEHGMTNVTKREKILEDQVKNLLDSFKDKFQKLGLDKKTAQEQAAELKVRYDATGDLQAVASDIRNQAKYLNPKEKKLAESAAEEVEALFKSQAKVREELVQEIEKEIQKKLEKSSNKQVASQKKAEGKIVKEAEQKGLELEQIENLNKKYEDVAELPFDTKGGELRGGKATFRDRYIDPETGEEVSDFFTKKYLEDTTPFQPSPVRIGQQGDELIGAYMNEATGEVFRKYKKLPQQDIDFSNMSVDDVLNWVKATQSKAFEQGGANADMYKELWKIGRNALPQLIEQLPKNKQDYSKMFAILDILGIDKSVIQKGSQYAPQDIVGLMKKLPQKMGTEKSYIERNLLNEGDNITKSLKDLDLTSDVNRIMEGSTSATGEFTRAGLAQKSTGLASEVAGAVYGKVGKPVVNVAGKTIKGLHNMSDAALSSVQKKLQEKGLESMSGQLQRAIEAEGPLRNALLWSMSQQPAIRKMLEDSDENLEEDFGDMMSTEELDISESKNNRTPSSIDTVYRGLEEKEGTGDLTGADDSTGKLGVTDIARKTAGTYQQYISAKTQEERDKIDEITAKKYLEILYKKMPDSWKNIPENIQDIFMDTAYNVGPSIFNYNKLNNYLTNGDYKSAAKELLDTANIQGKTSKGIAKRRAEGYNKIIDNLGGNPITEIIQEESGKIKYKSGDSDVYSYNTRKGRHESSRPGRIEIIKSNLDRIMKMKSSGMETPEYEIEKAFDGINQMDIPEEDKLELQNEVVQIESFSDVERIKSLLDKIGRKS